MLRRSLLLVWLLPMAVAVSVGLSLTPVSMSLYPGKAQAFSGYGDAQDGGRSNTRLIHRQDGLLAVMDLEHGHPTPYTGFGAGLVDAAHPKGMDFTVYDGFEIEMRSPTMRNVGFQIITWVDGFPRSEGGLPGMYQDLALPVTGSFSRTRVAFSQFSPSSWWPQTAGMEANAVPIRMDLVRNFELRIPIGAQPVRHDSLEIRSIRLVGRSYRPLAALALLALIVSSAWAYRSRKRSQTAPSALFPDAAASPSAAIPPAEPDMARVDLPNRSDLELQALLQWIGQNYHRESILVEEAARGCGLPVRRIPQLLKEHCGKTFPAYVSSLRIAQACRLLRETDRQVSEIGLAVGFSNTGNFHRVFKNETGESPASWREKATKTPGAPPQD